MKDKKYIKRIEKEQQKKEVAEQIKSIADGDRTRKCSD